MKIDPVDLKYTCPRPELMDRIGLGEYGKASCNSPFREDANPISGIYQASSGDWLFKGHATGEIGDEMHLFANRLWRNVDNEFNDLLEYYARYASAPAAHESLSKTVQAPKSKGIGLNNDHVGNPRQIRDLSMARAHITAKD